jgi:hypothetical protein
MLARTFNTERRQRNMAVAFLQELPGATQEQYDQVVETLRGQTAEGRIFHVSGPIEGGWRIVDVWESQEAVNKFFQEQLGPAAQEAGMEMRIPQFWPVHNMLSGPEHYLYSAS